MPAFDHLSAGLRPGLRGVTARPWPSVLAALTLAAAIGATTATFSLVHAVLLRPLPFGHSDRLVGIWSTAATGGGPERVSYPDFLDLQAQARTLERVAGWGRYEMVLTGTGAPRQLHAAVVTADFFAVLGVEPRLGTARRDAAGDPQARTVVLGHGLWRDGFGADAQVAGRAVALDGASHTVIGVMPPPFRFPIDGDPVDLWIVLGEQQFNPALRSRRDARLIEVLGLLRPGAGARQAEIELAGIAVALAREYPATNRGIGARVVPLLDQVTGGVSRALWMALLAVACVLVVACVNVANLQLARLVSRRRDVAVRAALGATRRRLARELIVESLPLAAAGAVLGVALAAGMLRLLVPLIPADVPRAATVAIDLRLAGIAIALALVAAAASALAPLWSVGPDVARTIQESARTAAGHPRARRLSQALAAAQMALALVLVAAAALFLGSLDRLGRAAPGADPGRVLTFRVDWSPSRYTPSRAAEAFRDLQTRLLAIPGVQSASIGLQLPDRGSPPLDAVRPLVTVEGRSLLPDEVLRTAVLTIQPGYFRAMGIPLRAGTEFRRQDAAATPLVAIVNASLARAYFPDGGAVGRRITLDAWTFFGARTLEIIGVAGDVAPEIGAAGSPLVYLPLAQSPASGSPVVVRTTGDPLAVVGAVRAVMRDLDPDQPLYDVQTLEARIAQALGRDRFSSTLLGVFAAVALAVAAAGLFSVVSHLVSSRRREWAIRAAVGAGRGDIVRLVAGQGMRIALAGMAAGLAGALAAGRAIQSLLFDISPADPATLAGSALLLGGVSLLACLWPAVRASRVDPAQALRID